MPTYLGIDCGGTSTRAVLASPDGHVLGTGRGGASNPNAAGKDGTISAVRTAVDAALAQANSSRADLAAVFVGMAGVVGADDAALARSLVLAAIPSLPPTRLDIDHDIRIALAGGLTGEQGIALICGTGSSCYGRTAQGTTHQSGGWGSVLDDGGSAHGLGLAAMKAAIRAADGRLPSTRLLPDVMRALSLTEIRQIVDRVYRTGMQKHEVAALAPVVIDAWQAGDTVATTIIDQEAAELAWIVSTVAKKLELASPRVCYTGGLIENSAPYRAAVHTKISATLPGSHFTPCHLPPVLGAVLLAYEHARHPHNPTTWQNLKSTLPA